MSTSTTAKRVAGIIAWLLAFHVLLAYGLPEALFITLIVLLGIVYWRIGAMGALTVSLTLVMALHSLRRKLSSPYLPPWCRVSFLKN